MNARPKSPGTQVPFSAPSCAGAGVLAGAITARGRQRLTRGSNHDHRPAKESFDALEITHPKEQPAITVPGARAGRKGGGK